ncbi:hypothetical protein [Exiguobacterium sp. RIT594]|uniref:hypothetical protein n=1 Tax=Exiguobacterium sp. RIT594 TaxID=2282449 RepID=UPI000DF73527|nr:hypothetical protein [Exiguobacterium sp. RIT594]RDB34795.1 hypothetical protein DVG79_09000 [Exiguobacterium sp. RIT594]
MESLIWVGLMIAFGVISVISKAADQKKTSSSTRVPSKEFGDYVKKMVDQVETQLPEGRDLPPAIKRKQQKQTQPVKHQRTELQQRLDERDRLKAQKQHSKSNIGKITGSIANDEIGKRRSRENGMHTTQEEIRQAIIWSEVLGPPVSKRSSKSPHR